MKRITFFILSILCFTACNNEVEINNPLESSPQIELIMPDAEEVGVYSTATESECKIENLWVCAFNPTTKQKKWVEKIDITKIAKNGQASQLLPQLSEFHKPAIGDSVICIANVDPNPDTANVTLNNINDIFKLAVNDYYFGGESLPMYGAMQWSSSNYTCTMIRAVAKVQIQMGTSVSDVTGNFTAENVTYKVFAAGDRGAIQPYPGGLVRGMPRVAGPGQSSFDHYFVQKINATASQTHVYFYEYPSATRTGYNFNTPINNKTFHADRQHIILTKNAGSGPTYYRLDFYNHKDSTFFDTRRNHHYIFTINKVRSEGYKNPGEAQSNPGSNIEYVVTISDDSKHITSNGQYALVTNADTATLSSSSSNTTLTIRREDPAGYSPLTHAITYLNMSPPSATFTIVAPTSITGTNTIVQVTTSSNFVSCDAIFTLGNVSHKVHFKRLN